MRLLPALALLALGAAGLPGCAAAAPAPRAVPAAGPSGAEARAADQLTVPRTVVTPADARSVPELHEAAKAELVAGRYAEAAKQFDRIYELDPGGALAPEALYAAGLAHDGAGDRDAALARFEQTATRHPEAPLAREALVRAVRVAAHLERWQRCAEIAELLMQRYRDLTPLEGVVAWSGKGLGAVFSDAPDRAAYFVDKGRTLVEDNRLDAAGALPRDVAQLYFALGELRRVRGEKIGFVPVPPNFADVLEQRCQLLLDAQSAYSDTMRAHDPHWSAMAGYRVGELYQRLHEDLMKIPAPRAADTEARRQLFEGAMRLRYAILLDKGLSMMEHTLQMAERTGEKSEWVDRARRSTRELARARAAEQAAIDRLPYTREQLKEALEELAKQPEPPAKGGAKAR
jgi:tetratricopeptide (TPR) repeat protein